MVRTLKQMLPSGIVPITLIDIDVNYFEMNIKYKTINTYISFKFIKICTYLSSGSNTGPALVLQAHPRVVHHAGPPRAMHHAGPLELVSSYSPEDVSRCHENSICCNQITAPHDQWNTPLTGSPSVAYEADDQMYYLPCCTGSPSDHLRVLVCTLPLCVQGR